MHLTSQLAAAIAINFVLLANSKPIEKLNHVAHETRKATLQGWEKKDRVHKDTMLPVRIGLSQTNLETGHSSLMDVSDPRSPNYGKHWSAEKVHDAFAPSPETVKEVMKWLNSCGIASHRVAHSKNKGWLAFDAPTHEVERLLNADYHEHHHSNGDISVGTDEYYLPPHIQKHVDYITPGVKLSASFKKRSRKRSISKRVASPLPASPLPDGTALTLANCDTNTTRECLKALYQIPDATTASPGNSLGLFEQAEYYSQKDLDMFFTAYAPNIPNGTYPIPAFIDGGMAPAPQRDAGLEPDVDIAIALSLIYPQNVTLYQTDDIPYGQQLGFTGLNGLFNTFFDALDGSYCTYNAFNLTGNSPGIDPAYPDPMHGGYNGTLMCGVYTPTNVISISYGVAEADQPANYLRRQCLEFMKLGLMGHTIFAATGDYGVAADPGDGNNLQSGCLGGNQTIFNPETPACPYVTTVGATRLYPGQSVTDPESALEAELNSGATTFYSSGGFSNIFPVADYQAEAVSSFFSTNQFPFKSYNVTAGDSIGANGGVFNVDGRGMPDVSANGAAFDFFLRGNFHSGFGTSLAAPIWGAIITLIIEARIAAGKGPVGFINPVLYQHPEVFNDITNGSNPGCHSEGFHAVDGWDPVTGLGTPKYPLLEELFLSLP